jgi:type IV secretory pathway VirB2 component (pilin)
MQLRDLAPPEFWTTVKNIDALKHKYGVPAPDLYPIVWQFSLIDSDAIEAAGREAWGIGAHDAGVPGTIAQHLPPDLDTMVGRVGVLWTGEAYRAFAANMKELSGYIDKLTGPSQGVGQALVDIATQCRGTWVDFVGQIMAVVGIVAAGLGLATAPIPVADFFGFLVAIIGFGLALVSEELALLTTLVPRLWAASNDAGIIGDEVSSKMPNIDPGKMPIPDPNQWRRKAPAY